MPIPDADVERVLVVAAHPDDIDFGAAGTVATLTDAGTAVTYLVCTYGEQGGFDDTPREQVPALRESEQRKAAAEVGVDDVRFLDGYRDGWLEPSWQLQRDIVRVLRSVRPQRVIAPSPERNWAVVQASHPDHLAAGEAAIRAVYPAARNPFAWPELVAEEGLEPWTVGEVWLMAHAESPHAVDITDVFDRKVAALRSHASQTGHLGDDLPTMLRGWGSAVARGAGLGEGRLAESFKVVPTG